MRLIEALAAAFISTFGITEPTLRQRRRAAWFITVLLALVVAGLCALGLLLAHLI